VTTTPSPTQPAPLVYTGKPRDIDAINAQWTQVVIHAGPTDELISQTKNDRIVRVLLLALVLKRDATVEYVDEQPPRLTTATVDLYANGEDGQVQRLSFNEKDGYFRATIIQKGLPEDGWTTNEQVQSVITAAARDVIPVGADIDPDTTEIVRAKVNVPIDDD
jgi:hypothetical protein